MKKTPDKGLLLIIIFLSIVWVFIFIGSIDREKQIKAYRVNEVEALEQTIRELIEDCGSGIEVVK